jgi:hypothetical protein
MHLVGARQLLGDLKAGVAAPDDEHRARRHIDRGAVGAAVELDDERVQALRDCGHSRNLERSGGHDDVVGSVGAVVEFDEIAAPAAAHRADGAVELDGKLEVARVVG